MALPSSASADETRRLAVLELRGVFEPESLNVLSDQLRKGALKALKGTGTEVMTRENMAMLARDMGIDLANCEEGAECEVDIGRNVGADLVLSGGVVRFGTKLTVTLKLHDTAKGSLLASDSVRATTEDELFDALPGAAEALLRDGLGLRRRGRGTRERTAVSGHGGSIREEGSTFSLDEATQEVVVKFRSEPDGALVLLDGLMTCKATPCQKRLEVGSYEVEMQAERYHPATKNIRVEPDMGAVNLSLPPTFGWLAVQTDPPGLAIEINSESSGKSPLAEREMEPNAYEVILKERCYKSDGETLVLDEGKHEVVFIEARERIAGLRVNVTDNRGNDLEATVTVDGRRLGPAPGPFELPLCSDEVTVHAPGWDSWSEKLTLTESKLLNLDASLIDVEEKARMAEEARQREADEKRRRDAQLRKEREIRREREAIQAERERDEQRRQKRVAAEMYRTRGTRAVLMAEGILLGTAGISALISRGAWVNAETIGREFNTSDNLSESEVDDIISRGSNQANVSYVGMGIAIGCANAAILVLVGEAVKARKGGRAQLYLDLQPEVESVPGRAVVGLTGKW